MAKNHKFDFLFLFLFSKCMYDGGGERREEGVGDLRGAM